MLFIRWQQLDNYVRKQIRVATGVQHDGFHQRVIKLIQVIQIDGNFNLVNEIEVSVSQSYSLCFIERKRLPARDGPIWTIGLRI